MTRSVEIPEEGGLQDLAWSEARQGIVNELRSRATEHERISAMGAQHSPEMRQRLAEMRTPSYAQQAAAERQLADQVAALPYLAPAEATTGAYEEYGVRYTSGPRKGSTPRRFRDLAQAVEYVAKGPEEMVVLHRVVTKWTEVDL